MLDSAIGAAPQDGELPLSLAGRYRMHSLIGEGQSKRVYRVHDESLDRDVAFARIKTEGLGEAGRERVRREARSLGLLISPREKPPALILPHWVFFEYL